MKSCRCLSDLCVMNESRRARNESTLLCPSAQPGMENCQVLGVLEGDPERPRLSYLNQHLPATAEILSLAGQASPTEVFRFAATCETKKCLHFDGSKCNLATRVVQILPAVVSTLPPCVVRADCRWYAQEGGSACLRCPQIKTQNRDPSEALKLAAGYQPGNATGQSAGELRT
jgi:hypothetical protein